MTQTPPPTFTVGGTISGLSGTVVLENNGGNDLSTSANGAFAFSTPLAQGAAYNVTVQTNPSGQTCTVANPSGTVAAANVTNVSVTCVTQTPPPTFTVGGTISGLSGTVVLENNGGNDLSTSANGAFAFSTPLAQGAAYNVTVKTNPSGQTCTVANPSGTVARGQRHQRLGHLRDPGRRLGLGQLQPGQRKPWRQLDRHDRRWAGHLLPGGGGHQRRLLG